MVAVTSRRSALDDEDDNYDPRFPGKKVVRDGGRVVVPLYLTDAGPPGRFTDAGPRFDINDARLHRPHQVRVDSADLRDAMTQAAEARGAYIARISDAWRGPSTPRPPRLRDGESPRDAYIRRLQTAYLTPPGQADPDGNDGNGTDNGNGNGTDADDIEAQRQRWLSPGAKPGFGDARPAPTRRANDAASAIADRNQAYAEYLARLENGWKTR